MFSERRPLLCAGDPNSQYSPPSDGSLNGRMSNRRHNARIIAGVSICLILCIAAIALGARSFPKHEIALVQASGDDLDVQYLLAESSGEDGHAFLKKLQDMWFVAKYRGMDKVANDATLLSNQLQLASFPSDMLAAIKDTVNPCDDFYEFACGTWDEEHKDKIDKILESDKGPSGTYYKACMDLDRIDTMGHAPLDPWLKVIDDISDKESLVRAVTDFNKEGMDVLFSWGIDRDPRNGEQYAFELAQGDTSMPDRTYFLEDSPEMEAHRQVFKSTVESMFRLIGRADPKSEAEMVFSLEKSIAEIQVDQTTLRGDHGTPVKWEDVEAMTPWWPWRDWLQRLSTCTQYLDGGAPLCKGDYSALLQVGTPEGKPLLLVAQSYFPKLQQLLETVDIDQIKASMRWKLLSGSISSLGTTYLDTYFPLMRDLFGTETRSPRPRKCYNSAVDSVAWPTAKLFYDQVFHKDNQAAALSMLEDIRSEFKASLEKEDWMAPEDRVAAVEKLSAMFFQVGGPTDDKGDAAWPIQTTALDGRLGEDMFTNDIIVSRLGMDRAMRKLDDTPERRDWGGGNTPMEVNAFYGPDRNGLWIPAGILQAPFFDASLPDARNFGSIGSILGHEMSHGFDNHGREFDSRGELKDWWHPATVEGYATRTKCYSDAFSAFAVRGRHISGELTLGEDLADAGGLKFAYRAFMAKAARTPAEERVFFTSFAQTWCSVDRAKAIESQILSDPHAPGKFRVIGGLKEFRPFSRAFHCPVGAPMAPPEEKLCRLW